MVILITGATHCGKTLLAQRLLEKYKYPYLSIDLLKMGLIRSLLKKRIPIGRICMVYQNIPITVFPAYPQII